jgi:hypothetical protein
MELPEEEILELLGRHFQPRTGTVNGTDEAEMDDLTLHWLQEQTRLCPSCGVRIQKIEGCDLMECMCGYRFCYRCGSQGAQCSCTPLNHYFWDNILDRQAHRAAPQVAAVDRETGHVDLQGYIRRQRVRRERQEEREATERMIDEIISDAWFLFLPEKIRARVQAEVRRVRRTRSVRREIERWVIDETISDTWLLFLPEKARARVQAKWGDDMIKTRVYKRQEQLRREYEADATLHDLRRLFTL